LFSFAISSLISNGKDFVRRLPRMPKMGLIGTVSKVSGYSILKDIYHIPVTSTVKTHPRIFVQQGHLLTKQ